MAMNTVMTAIARRSKRQDGPLFPLAVFTLMIAGVVFLVSLIVPLLLALCGYPIHLNAAYGFVVLVSGAGFFSATSDVLKPRSGKPALAYYYGALLLAGALFALTRLPAH